MRIYFAILGRRMVCFYRNTPETGGRAVSVFIFEGCINCVELCRPTALPWRELLRIWGGELDGRGTMIGPSYNFILRVGWSYRVNVDRRIFEG